jgi:hypothetical protein
MGTGPTPPIGAECVCVSHGPVDLVNVGCSSLKVSGSTERYTGVLAVQFPRQGCLFLPNPEAGMHFVRNPKAEVPLIPQS